MSGYLGTKAVTLSTTSATVGGDSTVGGDLTVDTNTLYVDSTNNRVGVGTASPSNPFQVGTSDLIVDSSGSLLIGRTTSTLGGGNGGLLQIGSGSSAAGLTIHSSTTGIGDIQFADGTTGADSYRGLIRYEHSTNSMNFWTDGSERMRINTSGDLLVGCSTTPSASVDGIMISRTPDITSSRSSTSFTSGTSHWIFYNPNGIVGSISTVGSATSFATSSDHRLKENVTDVTDGITRVKQLEPKRFNFIADPDRTVDGFLAHEAQAVVPEAVTGTHNEVDDDGNAVMQGIDQSKLVPLLTAALKEAITKIETLETEMTSVKARLDALEGN